MAVGVVLDDKGHPVCCEMWPGNTTDFKSLIPVVERLKNRIQIRQFCVVCDRGMISQSTLDWLEAHNILYILGARMRNNNEVKEDVLSRAGRYREVRPQGSSGSDPSTLQVKEVIVDGSRYIVCRNEKQARKDALDRDAIIASLEDKLKSGPKSLWGKKGIRKYLKAGKDCVSIDRDKIDQGSSFDGKWVLKTNTRLSSEKVALKYKELWQVEQVFRDMKSILETRAIYHQTDEAIRGHVFCSFLALLLRKELNEDLRKPNLTLSGRMSSNIWLLFTISPSM